MKKDDVQQKRDPLHIYIYKFIHCTFEKKYSILCRYLCFYLCIYFFFLRQTVFGDNFFWKVTGNKRYQNEKTSDSPRHAIQVTHTCKEVLCSVRCIAQQPEKRPFSLAILPGLEETPLRVAKRYPQKPAFTKEFRGCLI